MSDKLELSEISSAVTPDQNKIPKRYLALSFVSELQKCTIKEFNKYLFHQYSSFI